MRSQELQHQHKELQKQHPATPKPASSVSIPTKVPAESSLQREGGGSATALCRLGGHGPTNLLVRGMSTTPSASSTVLPSTTTVTTDVTMGQNTTKRKLSTSSSSAAAATAAAATVSSMSSSSPMTLVPSIARRVAATLGLQLPHQQQRDHDDNRPHSTTMTMMTTSLSTSVLPSSSTCANHRRNNNGSHQQHLYPNVDSQYKRNSSLGTLSSAADATQRHHQLRLLLPNNNNNNNNKNEQQQNHTQKWKKQKVVTSSNQEHHPVSSIPTSTSSSPTASSLPDQTMMLSPSQYLKGIFHSWNIPLQSTKEQSYFDGTTPERLQAYDRDLLMTVRQQDIPTLRSSAYLGHPTKPFVNACNPFGESILHLACRKGMTDMVQFLCTECHFNVYCSDDYGRTVFHDACWTVSPQWPLLEFLLRIAPVLLTMMDVRGHIPVDYVPKTDWPVWVNFFMERKELLRERLYETMVPSSPTKTTSSTMLQGTNGDTGGAIRPVGNGTITTTTPVAVSFPTIVSSSMLSTPPSETDGEGDTSAGAAGTATTDEVTPIATISLTGASTSSSSAKPATSALAVALQKAKEEAEASAAAAAVAASGTRSQQSGPGRYDCQIPAKGKEQSIKTLKGSTMTTIVGGPIATVAEPKTATTTTTTTTISDQSESPTCTIAATDLSSSTMDGGKVADKQDDDDNNDHRNNDDDGEKQLSSTSSSQQHSPIPHRIVG